MRLARPRETHSLEAPRACHLSELEWSCCRHVGLLQGNRARSRLPVWRPAGSPLNRQGGGFGIFYLKVSKSSRRRTPKNCPPDGVFSRQARGRKRAKLVSSASTTLDAKLPICTEATKSPSVSSSKVASVSRRLKDRPELSSRGAES